MSVELKAMPNSTVNLYLYAHIYIKDQFIWSDIAIIIDERIFTVIILKLCISVLAASTIEVNNMPIYPMYLGHSKTWEKLMFRTYHWVFLTDFNFVCATTTMNHVLHSLNKSPENVDINSKYNWLNWASSYDKKYAQWNLFSQKIQDIPVGPKYSVFSLQCYTMTTGFDGDPKTNKFGVVVFRTIAVVFWSLNQSLRKDIAQSCCYFDIGSFVI